MRQSRFSLAWARVLLQILPRSYLAVCWGGSAELWSLADPSLPVEVTERAAGARVAFFWGNKLVTNGRVHNWHGPLTVLEESSLVGWLLHAAAYTLRPAP